MAKYKRILSYRDGSLFTRRLEMLDRDVMKAITKVCDRAIAIGKIRFV